MPIYRGTGGSGESSTNALANEVAQDAADAANSANQAAASATSAANSATAAANSATDAAASETAAETAETNAETAETNAAASATAAATSETNAATSETNAATSETNAAVSASNASTSETNAANSASSASTSASNAATSETNAATSETNAATSETNAANSATQAATSATSAATSASDAATTYDNFDDRYLGEKTSNPSVDNDGDALITGALYFNSTAGQMRVWDGSAWEAAYLPASGYLHLSGGTMTGALELHANPSNNLEAATKQYVDDVAAEGIQYHSPVRVEVEGNLTVTYNNGTAGVGATLTNAGTQAALVIDDITMVVNDRVLIYEQTDATQNGIYTVTDIGSASTNWVLTRATDADSYAPSDPDALAQGSGFFVQEGTFGAGEKYVCNTVGTITFGTTNISFVQVATAQIYTAGTGISLNGSEINNTGLLTTGSTATDLAITSADINGGNIDGTIIGATTPAAATFATFTSNGIDDNATSTAITIDSSQNVSLSGDLTVDTDTLYVDSTNNRVGINDVTPSEELDITGDGSDVRIRLYDGAGASVARIEHSGANFDISNTATVTATMTFTTGSGAGTERMRIDSSGNVGIGGSPKEKLHVITATNGLGTVADASADELVLENTGATGMTFISPNTAAQTIAFGDTDNRKAGWIEYDHATNVMAFGTVNSSSERMRIDSSGNVGIGTNLPIAKTHITKTAGTALVITSEATNANTQSGYIDFQGSSNGTGQGARISAPYEATYGRTGLAFYTSNTASDTFTPAERMRIDSSGNLLVGATSPITGIGHLLKGSSPIAVYRTDSSSGGAFYVYSDVSGTQTNHLIIRNDGDVENTNNRYTGFSDIRLKQNIRNASSQTSDIMAVNVRAYELKATGETHIGVVADELEDAGMSGLVSTSKEQINGMENVKSVAYSILYMKAVKALQETISRVETLEAEVAALKGAN